MNNFTLESILEEIKKNLGEAKMKGIIESDADAMSLDTTKKNTAPTGGQADAMSLDIPKKTGGARVDGPGFQTSNEPSGDSLYRNPGSQSNAPAASTKPDQTPQGSASSTNTPQQDAMDLNPTNTSAATKANNARDAALSNIDKIPNRSGSSLAGGPSRTPPSATGSRAAAATGSRAAAARPATSAAPAQSRSAQAFQSYSDKGDDASSADFFRADRMARSAPAAAPAPRPAAARPAPAGAGRPAGARPNPAAPRISPSDNTMSGQDSPGPTRPAPAGAARPAAPQKPQQSNADYMRSSGMMDEANLEKKIRKMFEQKSAKFNPVAADYQDSSGPNKPVGKSEKEQHHGVAEEILQELGPNRRRKRSVYKTTLGRLEARNWGGNQSTKGRYSEEHTLSEARKAAFAKVNSKKKGRTDTGKPADIVDTEPKLNRMTGY